MQKKNMNVDWHLFDGGGDGDNPAGDKPAGNGDGKPKPVEDFNEAQLKVIDERIGKEREKWEEEMFGGYDPNAGTPAVVVDPSKVAVGLDGKPIVVDPNKSTSEGQGEEIKKLRGDIVDLQTRSEADRIDREIADAAKTFPLLDRKAVLFSLMAKPNSNIKKLAEESHKTKETEKQKIIDDYVQSKSKTKPKLDEDGKPVMKDGKPVVVPVTPPVVDGDGTPPGGGEKKPITFEEADEIARRLEAESSEE